MFPKNKINVFYRILCLICYLLVIFMVNSQSTLIILLIIYGIFGVSEKSFRNIQLIVITIVLLGISYLLNNYLLFKVMLLIDYCFYFLDVSCYDEEKDNQLIKENDYIRFKKNNKKNKKGLNNTLAIYLTVHLGVLFMAIVVG